MAYEYFNDLPQETALRRIINSRWHNFMRRCMDNPDLKLIERWWDFEKFLKDMLKTPGLDLDLLRNGGGTFIRVGSKFFSPNSLVFIPGHRPSISGREFFRARHVPTGGIYLVIDLRAFTDREGLADSTIRHKLPPGSEDAYETGDWVLSRARYSREDVVMAANKGTLIY